MPNTSHTDYSEFFETAAGKLPYGWQDRLAEGLKNREIKGLGVSALRLTRRLFRTYPQIRQSVITEFQNSSLNHTQRFPPPSETAVTLIRIRHKLLRELQFAIQIIPGPGNANVVAGKPALKFPPLHPRQIRSLGNTDLARAIQLSGKTNPYFQIGRKLTVEHLKKFVWNGKIHNFQGKDGRAEIKPSPLSTNPRRTAAGMAIRPVISRKTAICPTPENESSALPARMPLLNLYRIISFYLFKP